MAFDPDAYLAGSGGGFDPDAYLGTNTGPNQGPPGETPAQAVIRMSPGMFKDLAKERAENTPEAQLKAHVLHDLQHPWETLNTPNVNLPRVDASDPNGTPGGYGGLVNPITAEMYNKVLAPTAESVSTPLGAGLTVLTGGLLPEAQAGGRMAKLLLSSIGVGLGTTQYAQLPEQVRNAKRVANDPNATSQQKIGAFMEPAAGFGMSAFAALPAVHELTAPQEPVLANQAAQVASTAKKGNNVGLQGSINQISGAPPIEPKPASIPFEPLGQPSTAEQAGNVFLDPNAETAATGAQGSATTFLMNQADQTARDLQAKAVQDKIDKFNQDWAEHVKVQNAVSELQDRQTGQGSNLSEREQLKAAEADQANKQSDLNDRKDAIVDELQRMDMSQEILARIRQSPIGLELVNRQLEEAQNPKAAPTPEPVKALPEPVEPQPTAPEQPVNDKQTAINTAVKDPNTQYLYTVQKPMIEGGTCFVQVDAINPSAPAEERNVVSSNVQDWNKAGANIPDVPDFVPQGQYTLDQLKDIIQKGDQSNAVQVKSPTGDVLPAQGQGPGQGVELRGVVQGNGLQEPTVTGGAQEEVSQPRKGLSQGFGSGGQAGFITPQVAVHLAGSTLGAVGGYMSGNVLPRKSWKECWPVG